MLYAQPESTTTIAMITDDTWNLVRISLSSQMWESALSLYDKVKKIHQNPWGSNITGGLGFACLSWRCYARTYRITAKCRLKG